ncbi:uncharacterized protein LOC112221289 [Oncorhynchus tshawytscha]|uniref:uncharacterized protein LOC112221289 n=1 Tax=Oncorhynchus tshawytscha TaxID=74940 RepID=UPI000D0A41BE|nr:uncharacterized protein LOC112221289 [Oncorhynchus tshawytscha]
MVSTKNSFTLQHCIVWQSKQCLVKYPCPVSTPHCAGWGRNSTTFPLLLLLSLCLYLSPWKMKYANNRDMKHPLVRMRNVHSQSSLGSDTDSQPVLKEEEEEEKVTLEEEKETEEEKEGDVLTDSELDPELPEEYSHGLEDLRWNLSSLEKAVYLSLPPWVQRALLCNLMAKCGVNNSFFPARLLSYLLLPYILPASIFLHVNYRVLCWLRQVPGKWLWPGVEMAVPFLLKLSHPRKNLMHRLWPSGPVRFWHGGPARLWPCNPIRLWPCNPIRLWPCNPVRLWPFNLIRFWPLCFLASAKETHTQFKSAEDSPPQQRRRSVLRFQLSTTSTHYTTETPNTPTESHLDPLGFSLLFNLELAMDNQPNQPNHQPLLHESERLLPLEYGPCIKEEALASPHISYMGVEEEEERMSQGGDGVEEGLALLRRLPVECANTGY